MSISTNLAYRLRQNGRRLDPNKEYDSPRIKQIARKQWELFNECDRLDREIKTILYDEVNQSTSR